MPFPRLPNRPERCLSVAIVAFVLFFTFSSPTAQAADIFVDGTGEHDCTLADAIIASNTNAPSGGCGAGEPGHDRIILPSNAAFHFTAGDYGATGDRSALPSITGEVTIVGNHALLARDSSLPCPAPTAAQNFRLLTIEATGIITLTQISLQGGCGVAQGGAVRNLGGQISILDSVLHANQADFAGGAFSNEAGGMAYLSRTAITENSAPRGAGIYNIANSHFDMQAGSIAKNYADLIGGGILTLHATTILSATEISYNIGGNGGGIATNPEAAISSRITLTHGVSVTHNLATSVGGGAYLDSSLTSIDGTVFEQNTANEGGAIYLAAGELQLSHSEFIRNEVSQRGGAILAGTGTKLHMHRSSILANTARDQPSGIPASHAGGILALDSEVHITESLFSANSPGALVRDGGNVQLHDACVQDNQSPAIANLRPGTQESPSYLQAENVWWNAVDGPGGLGPGSGDAIDEGVTYMPFAAMPWEYCAPVGSDLSLLWTHTTPPPWLPGQPITLTLTLSNLGPDEAQEVWAGVESVLDDWPAFNIDSGQFSTGNGGWMLSHLDANASQPLTLTAVVEHTISQPVTGTLTATTTHAGLDPNTANNARPAHFTIQPPIVEFDISELEAQEGETPLGIPVALSAINPYAQASVHITLHTSDEAEPIEEQATIAAGQAEYVHFVSNPDNDVADGNRTWGLALHSPSGAQLGPQSRLDIHILDDDTPGVLLLEIPDTLTADGEPEFLQLQLTSRPLEIVQIDVASSADCAAPETLAIAPDEWNILLAIPISAPEDSASGDDRTCQIELHFTSGDPHYSFTAPYEFEFPVNPRNIPALALDLFASPNIQAGESVTITAQITNTGTVALADLRLVAQLEGEDEAEVAARAGELSPAASWEAVWTYTLDSALSAAEIELSATVTAWETEQIVVAADSTITLSVRQDSPSPGAKRLYLPAAAAHEVESITPATSHGR